MITAFQLIFSFYVTVVLQVINEVYRVQATPSILLLSDLYGQLTASQCCPQAAA